jgi:hypothetical protein
VNFTVQSSVPDLAVDVDSVEYDDQTTITGVTGIRRQLSAPLVQVLDGNVYQFDSWSDGGAATHFIFTPSSNTTYTANYVQIGTVPIGDGINASYFDNSDFTGTNQTRTDPQVNFIWSLDPPITGFGKDSFSVRWTGFIVAPTSETYTFFMNVDDGAKVVVNGKTIINQFGATGLHEFSGSIALTAGTKVPITIEYKDVSGFAQAQLSWSSALVSRQLVPQSALFTQPDPPPPPPNTVLVNDSADTYVRSGTPDTNFGGDDKLLVKNDGAGGNSREVYLRFDLTGLTNDFVSASLKLTGMINSSDTVSVGVYSSTSTPDWDEETLTWNTRFQADPTPLGSFIVNAANDKTYTVDLSDYLRNELTLGHQVVTLILKSAAPTISNAIFHSKESPDGVPQLVITPADASST